MDFSTLSAFLGVGVPASTGAGRVSQILREHLSAAGAADAVLNRDTGWLEVGRPGGTPERVARGLRAAGKSAFTLSFSGRIPPFRRAFLESQNLACLKVPRAAIFAFDIFYLTHPDSMADRALAGLLYRGLGDYPLILTCSEYSRGQISERFRVPPERILAVPLDCNRSIFFPRPVVKKAWLEKHNLPAGSRVLAHVSSGDKRKNLPGMLRAFKALSEKHPDAIFVKAGRVLHGRNHDTLLASLSDLGIQNKVFFLEGLMDVDLADLYNAADAFVFTSLAEGFGIPVLEAQACGCPVVTSNTTSLREVAGPLALAVDPNDEAAIAGAMDTILRDADFRTRNASATLDWLKRFSYDPARRAAAEWLAG